MRDALVNGAAKVEARPAPARPARGGRVARASSAPAAPRAHACARSRPDRRCGGCRLRQALRCAMRLRCGRGPRRRRHRRSPRHDRRCPALPGRLRLIALLSARRSGLSARACSPPIARSRCAHAVSGPIGREDLVEALEVGMVGAKERAECRRAAPIACAAAGDVRIVSASRVSASPTVKPLSRSVRDEAGELRRASLRRRRYCGCELRARPSRSIALTPPCQAGARSPRG